MKKLGLIFDQNTKRVFLLPEDVKKLTDAGVKVYVALNYGACNKIADEEYAKAKAEIIDVKSVVANADIILKVNAFTKHEIAAMNGKIAITLANFVTNVDMLLELIKNNVKSYQWIGLVKDGSYAFFQELETIKGKYAFNKLNELLPKLMADFNGQKNLAKQEAKLAKQNLKLNKFSSAKNKVLILNASFATDEILRNCLQSGMDVTLLDNDAEYCESLKNSKTIKDLISAHGGSLETGSSHFNTLEPLFKTHNVFINTCIDPVSKNPLRITKDMIDSMPCGSLAIDLGCENGYAFLFQKQLIKEDEKVECFNKLTKTSYICPRNVLDLFPEQVNKIISNKSVDSLIKMANDETDAFIDIIVTKEGKVLNTYLNKTLHI